jgi:hypothetical protein
VTGELIAVGVVFLTCRENFVEKSSAALGFLSLPTPPRDPSVDFGAFSLHTVKMDLTLLNKGLRRILITLTWECHRDLLNMRLQHLIEAQLVLCSYCEVVHLGIDVLLELVSGMNLLANFIIYPYLISDDISERGLISVEILPHTTLLAVVEWKTGFVPPSIEALIRTKTNVRITNEVDILRDYRAVDAHVSPHSSHVTRASTTLR